jgi:hypothetical protein
MLTAVLGCVMLSQAFAGGLDQQLSPAEKLVLRDFNKRVKSYVAKENMLPADKLKPKSDITELERRRVALREAIQQSRPDAKQGDIFTPAAANVFRKLLAQTLAGPDGAKIKASLSHAEPTAPPDFSVNGVFPNDHGQPIQSVPASLLGNLPLLPKGLEYCLAGKTLALRDAEANMVVDYLSNALP